jgi:hypothetical protein
MTITGIRDNVQTLLEATDEFVTILKAPPREGGDLEGYPAAIHYYNGTENDYATVSQNRRVINYAVDIILKADTATSAETELGEMYALADSIIQMFDTSNRLNAACDFLHPAPGDLERIQIGEGVGLKFTVNLYCRRDISIV